MSKRLTKQKILDAITKSHGMKTGTCELLGVSRPTLDKYIKRDPALQEAIDFVKVRWKDRAEYKLHEAIERGEAWAIMFTLKNAHDREYNDRLTLSVEKMTDDELANALKPQLARLGARLEPPSQAGLDSQASDGANVDTQL